eukprot:g28363.t1
MLLLRAASSIRSGRPSSYAQDERKRFETLAGSLWLRLGKLRGSSILRAALLLVCMLLRPQAAWEVFRTIGGSVSVAMCNDGVGLCNALSFTVPSQLPRLRIRTQAAGLCCLDRLAEALSRQLSLQVWSDLATAMHSKALQGAAFHKVDLVNPMQRIAEAKQLLEEIKGQLQYTGGVTVQMLYCLPLLVRGGGLLPAIQLLLLFATHFVVRTYWMPNIKARAALAACDLISHHSKDVQAMTAETSEIEDQLQVPMWRAY